MYLGDLFLSDWANLKSLLKAEFCGFQMKTRLHLKVFIIWFIVLINKSHWKLRVIDFERMSSIVSVTKIPSHFLDKATELARKQV